MPQQLNLLDPGLLPPKPWLTLGPVAAVVALALGAVALHGLSARDALALALLAPDATAEASAESAADAEIEALQRQVQRNAQLLATLADPTRQAPDSAAVLAAVVQALPPTVWLTEVELSAPARLRISGGTLDLQALPLLGARLAAIDALRGQPVSTVRVEPRVVEAATEASEGQPPAAPVLRAHLFTLVGGTPAAPDR